MSNDAELRKHQGEARYFLGMAKFQAGQYEEAAQQLDAALQDQKAGYAADAAYVRFKAREALAAKSPAAAIFLSKFPKGKAPTQSAAPKKRLGYKPFQKK